MNTIIKVMLTAVMVVAIAVPLLSLSRAATRGHDHHRTEMTRSGPFALTPQPDTLW